MTYTYGGFVYPLRRPRNLPLDVRAALQQMNIPVPTLSAHLAANPQVAAHFRIPVVQATDAQGQPLPEQRGSVAATQLLVPQIPVVSVAVHPTVSVPASLAPTAPMPMISAQAALAPTPLALATMALSSTAQTSRVSQPSHMSASQSVTVPTSEARASRKRSASNAGLDSNSVTKKAKNTAETSNLVSHTSTNPSSALPPSVFDHYGFSSRLQAMNEVPTPNCGPRTSHIATGIKRNAEDDDLVEVSSSKKMKTVHQDNESNNHFQPFHSRDPANRSLKWTNLREQDNWYLPQQVTPSMRPNMTTAVSQSLLYHPSPYSLSSHQSIPRFHRASHNLCYDNQDQFSLQSSMYHQSAAQDDYSGRQDSAWWIPQQSFPSNTRSYSEPWADELSQHHMPNEQIGQFHHVQMNDPGLHETEDLMYTGMYMPEPVSDSALQASSLLNLEANISIQHWEDYLDLDLENVTDHLDVGETAIKDHVDDGSDHRTDEGYVSRDVGSHSSNTGSSVGDESEEHSTPPSH
jgi:hypothetical protein